MPATLLRLLRITHSASIIRRYFVVNGFDGALTMLGLTMGFRMGGQADPEIALSACVGAAIALGVSGTSSAYISESAERKRALKDLEQAMITDLTRTDYGMAAHLIPIIVALVNGLAPLTLALVITVPLWPGAWVEPFGWSALDMSTALAVTVIFLLGVLLGRVSGQFWLWTGARAVFTAAVTVGLIVVFAP